MNRFQCVLAFLALGLMFQGLSAIQAEEFPEIMFILDASGSMWGTAGGETKIEAARRVFDRIVPELPAEVNLGLTAYGHRRKGDCSDIETIVSCGAAERNMLLDEVSKLNPKGMTPIADAVKSVTDVLKTKENETTIILVSDGEETCHADPCGVVRSLKSSGIKFILHVVGFDVDHVQKEQLSCLADAGGGEYYGAEDAESLLIALESVKSEVEKQVEKAKTVKKSVTTKIGKLRLSFPFGSDISINEIKVIRTSDNKTVKTVEDPGAESLHPLLSGEYELLVGFANPNYKPPTEVSFGTFEINGGETTDVENGVVSFNVAESLNEMSIAAVTVASDMPDGVSVTLEYHGNDYYLFKPKPVPAGTYHFSILYNRSPEETIIADNIQVKAGEQNVITLDSGIILVQPSDALGSVSGWNLIPAGNEKPILQVRRRWDNQEPLWRPFAVPEGTYDLLLILKGMDEPLPVGEGIVISAGELAEFDSGF